MENPIIISNLNDFIFCPASIYFHNIFGQQDRRLYQSEKQLNGTKVHETVDEAKNNKNVLHAMDVSSEKVIESGTVQDLISTVVDFKATPKSAKFINLIKFLLL